ncbi:BQ5605_C003g02033 [Microbotryum silenes-dioicae]|uniref:BQ5605_C003g02033 protein n=1 Tax=Microbotryum silenes-dioicae TaxID=796604 RepID=A0A2X0M4K4_9BASI|nr:BQ5605_C003g02033 [Microbotryum silenes-dioicae]
MKENVDKTSKPKKMACTESWKAADGGSDKLSKRKIDTGLVAGVCRHDIALAMVNLEGLGEKLDFALAIVNQISKHVPTETRIGVLYDIACNFKHHIETRQLVPALFERLEFATSRLWSALRSLIPINRQSDKSHRLVNLAVRTQAVNEANVARLGSKACCPGRTQQRYLRRCQLVGGGIPRRAAWQEQRTVEASKTATQGAEEDRLKANKLYQLVEEYYRIERRIDLYLLCSDEEDSDLDLLEGLKDKQGRLARDIYLAAFIEVQSGPGLSPKDLRHLCQCSVALRKLHCEVIAYKTSREKLLSTPRGGGGSTLGQRSASKARKVELKTLSGVEKARKAYNKAVNAFQTAGGTSPSHLLSNFPIASSGHSVIELEETDSFWHDGFFTHAEAAWATDVLVKRGIVAVRNLDRADEEFARLGAEVRQALAWVEDEQDLISNRQALWSSALGEFNPLQLSMMRMNTEQHRLRTAIGGSDYATVRDRALNILAARMENLRKLKRAWFRDSSLLVLWNETRGPAGDHEPMPAARLRLSLIAP